MLLTRNATATENSPPILRAFRAMPLNRRTPRKAMAAYCHVGTTLISFCKGTLLEMFLHGSSSSACKLPLAELSVLSTKRGMLWWTNGALIYDSLQ